MLTGRGQTIPASGKYFMYEDLKKLFGTKTPSAKQFKAKLKMLSEEEQCFYRKAALEAAFLDWENMPPRYQEFMTDLFIHRWQKKHWITFYILPLWGRSASSRSTRCCCNR